MKFKYGQPVVVTKDGFYKGSLGFVCSEAKGTYTVLCPIPGVDHHKTLDFKETDLTPYTPPSKVLK